MFCPNCGKELSDDSTFCGYCGARVTGAETVQPKEDSQKKTISEDAFHEDDSFVESPSETGGTQKAGAKNKEANTTGKKRFLGFALMAAGIFIVIGMINLLSGGVSSMSVTEVDLNNYVGISYQGYDGYGTAQSEFYYDDYQDSIEKALEGNGILDDENLTGQQKTLIDQLFDMPFTYSIDKDSGLRNGDKVSVAFDIKDISFQDIGIELKGETKAYEVSGLEPIQEIDPFENFSIEYSGTAPFCSASWSGGLRELTYTLSKTENLRVGDTITVTVDYLGDNDFSEFTQKTGLTLTQTEKTFTVQNVDTYAMSTTDISEAIRDKMDKVARDSMMSKVAHWDNPSSYKGMDFLGYYYLTPKKNDSWWGSHFYLYSVYKVNVVEESGNVLSYYTYWQFEDPMILADGTCTCNLDQYEHCFNTIVSNNRAYNGYTTLEGIFNDCVSKNIEEYEYEDTVQEKQSQPEQSEAGNSDDSEGTTAEDAAETSSTQE